MENTKTWLEVVRKPNPRASIIAPDRAPAFVGDEGEKLHCGSCSQVLSDGASITTIRSQHQHIPELIVRCPDCGALNEISTELIQQKVT